MPRLLTYDGKPVALVEFLPNNAYGPLAEHAEGEVCGLISPDEGAADIVEVSEAEAARLRLGEPVDVSDRLPRDFRCQDCEYVDGEVAFVALGLLYVCPSCGSTHCSPVLGE